MSAFIRAIIIFAIVVLVMPTVASAGVTATSTVSLGTGQYAGYWCYTISYTWDSPQSLSNVGVFLGLEGLECACEPGLFVFPVPAGSSVGESDGESCSIDYEGNYSCQEYDGYPPEFANLAVVRFDPISEPCEAGSTGSGTLTFYSLLAPGSTLQHPDKIVIKHGSEGTTLGSIIGPLPAANCAVPSHVRSWSTIKIQY
jgi:hypothetical protein